MPDKTDKKILILENIRSVHNVGSIFRTADSVQIDKIILVGETPTPLDRFGRERKDLAKVALGAEKNIKWEYYSDEEILEVVKNLKEDNFKIISLEQNKDSIDYKKIHIASNEKVSIILGNEVRGVSEKLIKISDQIAEIPMKGKKESLNVSVAAGVLLYRLFDI